MSTRTLAVITAGLSQPSSTRLLAGRLASAVTRHLAEAGEDASVTIIELRDLAHDITDALLTGFASPALRTAVGQVTGADGLIAVTPLFSDSYSGLFKSFFDVLDPGSLDGQRVLIAATGGTPRHSLALEHAVRPLLTYLHAAVAPTAVFAATADWGDRAEAQALRTRIDRAGRELATMITAAAARRQAGDPGQPASRPAAVPAPPAPPAAPAVLPVVAQARDDGDDPFASFTPFDQLLRGA
jgi:FMN reductase